VKLTNDILNVISGARMPLNGPEVFKTTHCTEGNERSVSQDLKALADLNTKILSLCQTKIDTFI
jgi:hypothetical protein